MLNGRAFIRGRGKAKSFPASLEAGKSVPPLEGKWFYQVKQRLFTYNSPRSSILWGREKAKTFTGEGETPPKQKGKWISLSLEEENSYFWELNLFTWGKRNYSFGEGKVNIFPYGPDYHSTLLWNLRMGWALGGPSNYFPPPPETQCQQFLSCYWPDFDCDETLNVSRNVAIYA